LFQAPTELSERRCPVPAGRHGYSRGGRGGEIFSGMGLGEEEGGGGRLTCLVISGLALGEGGIWFSIIIWRHSGGFFCGGDRVMI